MLNNNDNLNLNMHADGKIKYKKLIRRWDIERGLFYNDIVHVLQNTMNWRINSATGRRTSLQDMAYHSVYCRNNQYVQCAPKRLCVGTQVYQSQWK